MNRLNVWCFVIFFNSKNRYVCVWHLKLGWFSICPHKIKRRTEKSIDVHLLKENTPDRTYILLNDVLGQYACLFADCFKHKTKRQRLCFRIFSSISNKFIAIKYDATYHKSKVFFPNNPDVLEINKKNNDFHYAGMSTVPCFFLLNCYIFIKRLLACFHFYKL